MGRIGLLKQKLIDICCQSTKNYHADQSQLLEIAAEQHEWMLRLQRAIQEVARLRKEIILLADDIQPVSQMTEVATGPVWRTYHAPVKYSEEQDTLAAEVEEALSELFLPIKVTISQYLHV